MSAESLEQWMRQLKRWQVPFVGPMTRAGTEGAEIYFNDPDGNHLELHCSVYPDHDQLPAGPYDKNETVHQEPCPPPKSGMQQSAARVVSGSDA